MKTDEFNELFKRYARHRIFLTEQEINKATNRRAFLLEQYVFQLTESVNMCRDPYRGHLVTLLKQGLRQNLPLSYIIEEMENYRMEFLEVLTTVPGIETQLLFDESVYEDGYKPKIRAVLDFFSTVSVTRFLKQKIRHDYPLALSGDDTPDEAPIFDITENIGKPYTEIMKETTPKERRIEYPEEMSAEEAAEYLNFKSVESLYQLTSAKKIPHYKRGRKLMFKKSELQNWRVQKIASGEDLKMESANRLLNKPLKNKRRL
jgi:excisionase family DNA binding protein